MKPVFIEEVFKTNGVPTYTFVRPDEWERLCVALRTPGRGIVIEGPSGIGKTTAVSQALSNNGMEAVMRLSARRVEDVEFIRELPRTGNLGTVIVDDFHKLDLPTKHALADLLKTLADSEATDSKLVVIGINDAGRSLIGFAADLVNRIEIIPFETNPEEKVDAMIRKGEETLNVTINIRKDICEASQGSFYIAQMLCHALCLKAGLLQAAPDPVVVSQSFEGIKAGVCERLGLAFRERCKRFCRGSKMRPEGRAPYLHILHWLAESDRWTVNLDEATRQHPALKGSVGQVVNKGYLEQLVDDDPELQQVLHYDPHSKQLTVEDPQFVYYIRNIPWLEFSRDLGFSVVEFTNRYDFALSFAGANRELAEALYARLSDEEVEVFYDKNEQHRILAENIEEYLRPIYQTEARLVVCLLSKDYPTRIWTRFESQTFKERFQDGDVVPVWFSDAPPGMFDEARKFGGIEFDTARPIADQVDAIARLLLGKLKDVRAHDERDANLILPNPVP